MKMLIEELKEELNEENKEFEQRMAPTSFSVNAKVFVPANSQ